MNDSHSRGFFHPYFGDILMINAPSNAAPNTNTAAAGSRSAADAKQIVLKEIGSKWSKFSEQDLSDLKDKDDLRDRSSPGMAWRNPRPARRRCPDEGPPDLTKASFSGPQHLRPRPSIGRSPEARHTHDRIRVQRLRFQPSKQSSSRREATDTSARPLSTDASRTPQTPFVSQSKSFRPDCFLARFLRLTVRDTTAKKFVACTTVAISRYPGAQ